MLDNTLPKSQRKVHKTSVLGHNIILIKSFPEGQDRTVQDLFL